VVEVNRAVAVAMAEGPLEGLKILDGLDGRLEAYYPFHVARANLLQRSNQCEAAAQACARAHLQRRLDTLSSGPVVDIL